MSESGEWKDVPKSGKSKAKKGKSPQKGNHNDQTPKSANDIAPKGAKGGSATPKKEANADQRKESLTAEAPDPSSPWLCIADEPEELPKPSPQNTPNESHKKKHKKKKNKNKDRSEHERDLATPKEESAETESPPLTNGMKSDPDEAGPKTVETTISEPEEVTKAGTAQASTIESKETDKPDDDNDSALMSLDESAEDAPSTETKETTKPGDDNDSALMSLEWSAEDAPSTETKETTKPDDDNDSTPMSWEDNADNVTKADETESQSAADGEESVSQTSGDATDKDKKSTEESAGESSPEKKSTDAGARQKVVMHWNKVQSKDRVKTESGDVKSSRDQKQHGSSSKKPKTESPDPKSQSSGKSRDHSHERRSSSANKTRDDSRNRGKSGGNQRGDSTNQHQKNVSRSENTRGHSDRGNTRGGKQEPSARGKRGGQGSAGSDRMEEEQWSRSEPLPIVGFELQEIKGDLFQCADDDAMAHCVSEDLEMGKGIAVLFKQAFGKVGRLRAQEKKVGDVAVLQVGKSYVYYLITKECYFHKPRYDSLRSSLLAMRAHCKENGVTSVAMPQIGCGLDKLNWGVVMEIIKEVFNNTNMTIKIYYYSG